MRYVIVGSALLASLAQSQEKPVVQPRKLEWVIGEIEVKPLALPRAQLTLPQLGPARLQVHDVRWELGIQRPVQRGALKDALAKFDAERKKLDTAQDFAAARKALDLALEQLVASREALWEQKREAAEPQPAPFVQTIDVRQVLQVQAQRNVIVLGANNLRRWEVVLEQPPEPSPFLSGDYLTAVRKVDAARAGLGSAGDVEAAFEKLDELQRALMAAHRELRAAERARPERR